MKAVFLILSFFTFRSSLVANIGPRGFDDFKQNYFVETGTFMGNGIELALKAGFKQVRSIEFDNKFCKNAQKRFSKNPNVQIYRGDSSTDLFKLIQDIEEPITFWLDAHICPSRKDPGKNCPLIEELEQIKQHPIKNHIILIDDMHCCNTELFDFMNQNDFIEKLLEINPDYEIAYVDGGDAGEYKNNVMVAIPPTWKKQ